MALVHNGLFDFIVVDCDGICFRTIVYGICFAINGTSWHLLFFALVTTVWMEVKKFIVIRRNLDTVKS